MASVKQVVEYGRLFGIESAMKRYENSDTAVLVIAWQNLKRMEAERGERYGRADI